MNCLRRYAYAWISRVESNWKNCFLFFLGAGGGGNIKNCCAERKEWMKRGMEKEEDYNLSTLMISTFLFLIILN